MEATVIRQHFKGDRISLRTQLMAAFAKENPGTGSGDLTSRYVYIVEKTPSGHEIQLYRPAILNKGIDFLIKVPSVLFNTKRRPWPHVPTHSCLHKLLIGLKEKYPRKYKLVSDNVLRVFEGQNPMTLESLAQLTYSNVQADVNGIPADVAVLAAKWLFAEQDLTYWNNSGRQMLFNSLVDAGLI